MQDLVIGHWSLVIVHCSLVIGHSLERILIAALLLLALSARLIPGERIVDDAYITFRYARNLVEEAGLVYNPPSAALRRGSGQGSGHCGERVLGTTTPLYTLLLAGLSLATGCRDLPALACASSTPSGW